MHINTQGTGIIVVSLLLLLITIFCVFQYFRRSPHSALYSYRYLIYSLTASLGLLIIFAVLPIDSNAKNNVFSLLGLLITAVIALSSTTFVANIMAGVMLKSIKHYKAGDFVDVDNHFGRVSEMGLLHTEIQTKTGDYTTLPNMFLVTNPVTVTRSDKALIDATVSLGYDVSHHTVETVLLGAASSIGLTDSFVQVTDLGDYSIHYRVAGFGDKPKLLLSMRSNLRKQMIDSLHKKNIEIVSPAFLNQRHFDSNDVFVSRSGEYEEQRNKIKTQSPIFDKAELAEKAEHLQDLIKNLDKKIKEATSETKDQLVTKQNNIKKQLEVLNKSIETHET